MASGFKIADAYVEVKADAAGLRVETDKAVKEASVGQSIRVGINVDSNNGVKAFDGLLKSVTSSVMGMLGALGKGVVSIAAIGSTALTAAPYVAKAATAVVDLGRSVVQVAPMLLAFAAAGVFVKLTMDQIGPAILKQLAPISDGFKAAGVHASDLATKGVHPLAVEFEKLGMPIIASGMDKIAVATNGVVVRFLQWADTKAGLSALRSVVDATGLSMTQLGPHVSGLLESLGNMIGRIAGVSLAAGTNGLSGVLDRLSGWLDRINADTVRTGLDDLHAKFVKVKDAVSDLIGWIKDGMAFWKEYRVEIKAVQDAVSLLAIVFGGPVVAVVAAVGLIIRHWNDLKAAWSAVINFFQTQPNASGFLDSIRDAADKLWPAIQKAFKEIADAVGPPLHDLWVTIRDDVLPALSAFITAVEPLVQYLVRTFGPIVAEVFGTIVRIIDDAFKVIAGILKVFTGLLTGNWSLFWQGIEEIVGAVWDSIKALVHLESDAIGAILRTLWDLIRLEADRAWSGIRGLLSAYWNSMVGEFENVWSRIEGIASSIWNNVVGAFKWGVNQVIGLIDGLVHGADDVLGFLDLPLIPSVPLLAAGGTIGGGGVTHGPMAIVGEGSPSHPEYVIPTDPAHRASAIGLYQSLGAKLMAGGGIIDWIGSTVSKVEKWAGAGATGLMNSAVDGLAGGIPAPFHDIATSVGHSAVAAIKSLIDGAQAAAAVGGAFSAPFTGSPNLGAWIQAALGLTGTPQSWAGPLSVLIGRESGGNPNAINLTDSNAAAGHPSQGLMQTIPGTFSAYHQPGTSFNITDPVANIAAGINYIKARYGSIFNVQQANPNASPQGYDSGGLLPTGLTLAHNTGSGPERVLNASQTAKLDRLLAGSGRTGGVTVNVTQLAASAAETGRYVALALRTVA